MKGYYVACFRGRRACTLPLRFADNLKVGNRDQAASIWYQRITCLIPVRVVFSADYMEKVALGEAEFLSVARVWVIIVQGFDDLGKGDRVSTPKQTIPSQGEPAHSFRCDDGDCGFGCDGDVVRFWFGLVALN